MEPDLSHILTHLGEDRERGYNAVVPPIVQSGNFTYPTVAAMRATVQQEFDKPLYTRGFNPTVAEAGPNGWISPGEFGLDQGMIVLMIENYRSGLPWRLGRANPFVRAGLHRAGFKGGWL